MKPDISNLSVAELEKLTDEAGALIESKKEQELDTAYDKITEIAASVGVTLDELVGRGNKTSKTTTRKPVAPRYRNPENQQETWTGRGKQPRWLAGKLAGGAKLEDFLI
ncbi:MAG: H-NS histone family protein [Moraxellaceae bacterium]|nr:MAG: H-NS histone family protein [Moraxellaceae bacterium]